MCNGEGELDGKFSKRRVEFELRSRLRPLVCNFFLSDAKGNIIWVDSYALLDSEHIE